MRTFVSCVSAVIVVTLGGFTTWAQAPNLMTYQGRVSDNGAAFNGAGLFKLALVSGDGAVTYWSNDGTSVGGGAPAAAVSTPVSNGLFTVVLGDSSLSNMAPITQGIFTNSDVRLRLWFSDGANGFAQLSPDQRLTSSPFAMLANGVPPGSITGGMLAAGAVTYAQLAVNAVTTPALSNASVTAAKLAQGSVTAPALAQGAVTSASLASQSVTSYALAPGAVTGPSIATGTIDQSKLNFQSGYINAQNPPYGATGNGTNDDTGAIQAALNAAGAAGGGIVFLPRGNYLINTHLVVPPQTSLVGVWRAVQAFSQNFGTTLLAVESAGTTNGAAFITLQGNNSTLEGVTIFYPNQITNNPPTPYPWAIRGGGGDNVTVQNVTLVNPYLGIDLATYTCARHLIRFVYGQPLLVGIAVDQCYDIGRIMDIHFWPFWTQNANIVAFQSANAVTFDLMRTDWEIVENVFSWGYAVGARFRASANGSMNGQMSDVNFDNVDVGLQMINTQPYAVHISNLNIANAGGGTNHIAIQGLPGNAALNVSGATFWGSLIQPVAWNNSGLFTLSNARFLSWSSTQPCIHIQAGRAMLNDNYFTDNIGLAIKVEATANRAMVIGNMLCGNTVSLAGSTVTTANNQP